jgi:hypothetical protein
MLGGDIDGARLRFFSGGVKVKLEAVFNILL